MLAQAASELKASNTSFQSIMRDYRSGAYAIGKVQLDLAQGAVTSVLQSSYLQIALPRLSAYVEGEPVKVAESLRTHRLHYQVG
jgi:hypothetical protein